jgi:hypothetical protein
MATPITSIVHVHQTVPQGTNAQQLAALRAGSEAAVNDTMMQQINKQIIHSIHKAARN